MKSAKPYNGDYAHDILEGRSSYKNVESPLQDVHVLTEMVSEAVITKVRSSSPKTNAQTENT